jgi:alpha-glucoside transport system substrate-binding protein
MLKHKIFQIAIIAALAVTTLGISAVRAAPPGCPAGTFELMSKELEAACKGEYAGKVVTVGGTQDTADAVSFQNSFKQFEEWTGITVAYNGGKQFEGVIDAEVAGGQAPDLADFPQPGFVQHFAQLGKLVDISKFMNPDWLKKNYAQFWLDLAMVADKDGKKINAGVFGRNSVKSLVWYPKKAWDAAGYKVPETWDDLIKLSDQIVKDGATPWCIGIESGAATGWPATDWVEDIMLRTTTLENYDNWATPVDPAKRVKFTDPVVKAAIQKMDEIWKNDKYVDGGSKAIPGTAFGDAPKGLFTDPPKCYLHRQATFITSFFPKDASGKDLVAGVDYDFFYFPQIDAKMGKPILGAADIMVIFNDKPEARAVLDWLSRGLSIKTWIGEGSTLAPMNDVKPEWYANDIQRKAAAMVAAATAFRFDGSDLMPAAVGAGSFWKGMTSYYAGTTDLDTTLAEIDAAWPK